MSRSLAAVAFNELDHKLTGASRIPWRTLAARLNDSNDKLVDATMPLFVSWKKNGELRGCIGTFSPHAVEKGVRQYALISALEDERFDAIKAKELPQLAVSVTLLSPLEPVDDPYDWTIGEHGVQATWGSRYSATFLPDVPEEQGWSQEDTLQALATKAGLPRGTNPMKGIQLSRYEGIKAEISFKDYCLARDSEGGQ